jgi:tRNA threonylcarbamoyl adenosine modification protein (Sua5/YciO/YrdC/YwlC family)
MLIRLYERNPSERELQRIVALLERDGIIVYPTDSVYAFGCSLRAPKAVERLRRLKGKSAAEFAAVFDGIARIAEYCRVDNAAFRMLKRNLPGPFTFVLPASAQVPDKALGKRRTLGVRIPGHAVARAIVEALGCPLVTTSLPVDAEEPEYAVDPELIHERYGRDVAAVVDGGAGTTILTTVVDLTGDEPVVLREGGGELR